MASKEAFLKYINGFNCTREEYLEAQDYLRMTPDVKALYENYEAIIVKSLMDNRKKSELHFLRAISKHGLTLEEALAKIEEYSPKAR